MVYCGLSVETVAKGDQQGRYPLCLAPVPLSSLLACCPGPDPIDLLVHALACARWQSWNEGLEWNSHGLGSDCPLAD